MIDVICDKCGTIYVAAIILGLIECPECGCKEAHVALLDVETK